MSTKLDAALRYAAHGIAVLPVNTVSGDGRCSCGCTQPTCFARGKHPLIANWQSNASVEVVQIGAWWLNWPDANIGGFMRASGMVCIDIDPRNDGDNTWYRVSRTLEPLPDTWTALSGGGGAHLFFKVPDGYTPNAITLGPGVDVKYNGYVILPPSNHYQHKAYEWEIGCSPDDIPLAPLPADLAYLLNLPASGGNSPTAGRQISQDDAVTLLTRSCRTGERHITLLSILGWARHVLNQDEAIAVLAAWNNAFCEPPMDENELVRTIDDIYRRYGYEPRSIASLEEEDRSPKARFDFVDYTKFRRRKPPEWLIAGMVPETSFTALVGAPGSGKTLVAVDLACSMATGRPVWGHKTRQGKVLYIAGEGQAGLALRCIAWEVNSGQLIDEGWLTILPEPVNMTAKHVPRLLVEQIIREIDRVDVVFIDTLARSMPGADENNGEIMGAVIAGASLIQRTFGATVVVVHHGRKSDGALRGHSSLAGAVDNIIGVSKDGIGLFDTVVTLECLKQKDAEPFAAKMFNLKKVDVLPELRSIHGEDHVEHSMNMSIVLEQVTASRIVTEDVRALGLVSGKLDDAMVAMLAPFVDRWAYGVRKEALIGELEVAGGSPEYIKQLVEFIIEEEYVRSELNAATGFEMLYPNKIMERIVNVWKLQRRRLSLNTGDISIAG